MQNVTSMKNTIGRNDPCPCGSGKKYKKCHWLKSDSESIPMWRADQIFKKTFDVKECLCPAEEKWQCSGNIINAHTISKSQNLKQIADQQHVYGLSKSFQDAHRLGGPDYKLLSINKASTFTGFCSYHDDKLFGPLEKKAFIGSKEQCLLLAYRIIARELFLKKISMRGVFDEIKEHQSLRDAIQTNRIAVGMEGNRLVAVDDLSVEKQKYDDAIIKQDFSGFRSCLLFFKRVPSLMFAGATTPIFDFEANELFDLGDYSTRANMLTFSTIALEDAGCVVFSWMESENCNCERFIESIKAIKPERLTDAIINFIFETCENHFMNPIWWNGMPHGKRNELIERFQIAIGDKETRRDCLCGLTYHLDDWGFDRLVEF